MAGSEGSGFYAKHDACFLKNDIHIINAAPFEKKEALFEKISALFEKNAPRF
jgi:hypothetical protein